MYIPAAFQDDDIASIHAAIRGTRLANLVTMTAEGLMATPIPLILETDVGPRGVLYGHVARANPQWRAAPIGAAMAIFMGPDAYVSPSWYATKAETGKVVPTWNYVTVHATGPVEYFEDSGRLLDIVTRLTNRHEASQASPWKVSDAPESYLRSQLRGIVGVRLPITRLEGKRKLSQNRSSEDRAGVIEGLGASQDPLDRAIASLVPK